MTRKEFLSTLGIGATFALTATCLGGCSKDVLGNNEPVDFYLDLTDSANIELQKNGSYIITNQVVVARTTTGEYVAATIACSHDGHQKITLRDDEWYCTSHGARFDLQGDGLNKDGRKGLTIYQTRVEGDTLHVFS